MRRVVVLGAVLLVGGCSARAVEGVPLAAGGTSGQVSVAPSTVAVPASPVPGAEAKCPYLDNTFVADANGQRVSKVRVSRDRPHPACFFYRADGRLQLSVWVYQGDAATAKALVDQAAPVATANPASLPAGWAGGAQATDGGAVFAVAKEGAAVVITTNQAQTIKAKRVAEQAISALGL